MHRPWSTGAGTPGLLMLLCRKTIDGKAFHVVSCSRFFDSSQRLDTMWRTQHRGVPQRLALLSPPLRSRTRFHRHDLLIEPFQPLEECASAELFPEDCSPGGVDPNHMGVTLGQIDTDAFNAGKNMGVFGFFHRGLDFHRHSFDNGTVWCVLGEGVFATSSPFLSRKVYPGGSGDPTPESP